MPRRISLAFLLVFVLILFMPGETPAVIVEEIVARVNNRIISKSEFEERGQYILQEVYQKYSGAELDERLRAAEDTLLSNLITELLLVERAETLFDLDKVREGLIEDFLKQQKIETDEELERMLADQGLTRADLEEQLVRLAVPQEIVNYDVKRKISVSDREVGEYYKTHEEDYTMSPTVTFREIVIFYESHERDQILLKADAIVEEAKGGADFLSLIARDSEAGTREAGGLLGPLAEGDLNETIARVVTKMKVEEISDVIDTGRSVHIVRLEAKTERIVTPLEDLQDNIYSILQQQKFKPRFDRYVRRLWKDSYVKVMPKYEQYLVVSPLNPRPGPPQARND